MACLLCLGIFLSGCANRQIASHDDITVEGYVVMMGNEPFAELILKTSDNNSYVLKMEPEMRSSLMTPATLEVTGKLYLGSWNGSPFAHIEVREYSRTD